LGVGADGRQVVADRGLLDTGQQLLAPVEFAVEEVHGLRGGEHRVARRSAPRSSPVVAVAATTSRVMSSGRFARLRLSARFSKTSTTRPGYSSAASGTNTRPTVEV
jgi:hypothetical protein